jgi:hypothetical protein
MKVHITIVFETDDGARILNHVAISEERLSEGKVYEIQCRLETEYRKADMAEEDYRQLELDL